MTALPASDLATIVRMIVSRHGPDVLDHRQRLFALLRDHAPGDFRAIRLLMSAFDSGAAERLRALDRNPSEAEIAAEIALMTDRYGADPALARMAVQTWARVAAILGGRDQGDPVGSHVVGSPLARLPLAQASSSSSSGPAAGHPVMLLPLPSGPNPGEMSWFRRRATILVAILVAIVIVAFVIGTT